MSTEPFDAPVDDGVGRTALAVRLGRRHLGVRLVLSVVAVAYGAVLSFVAILAMVGLTAASESIGGNAEPATQIVVTVSLVVPAVVVGGFSAGAALVVKRWAVQSFAIAGGYFWGSVALVLLMEAMGSSSGLPILWVLIIASVIPGGMLGGVAVLSGIEEREQAVAPTADDAV